MKSKSLRIILSAISLCSVWLMTISASAAPIRFSQVVQVVDAKPGKAGNGNFTQLRMINDDSATIGDDDDTKKTAQQDGRVIVETRSDIVEDDACDCPPVDKVGGGFPKYALFGLAAIPLFFIIRHHHDDTPTPTPTSTVPPSDTPTITPTPTPTDTPTPTPTMTPTPTPNTPTPTPTPPTTPTPTPTPNTPTPTPTPPDTPTPTPTPPPMTPTPTPTPEPVTMLLFGTGLAGIGFAARKRLRRKGVSEDSTEE